MKLQYFYDAQIERFIKHLVRMFSSFQVHNGYDPVSGAPVYKRVPCRYGDISKQSANVIKQNSENMLNSAPMMVINIDSMDMSRENVRGQTSEHVVQGINQKDANGNYTNQLEGYYEVERINPVPWDIEFSVSIWTTNQTNKYELFEQISTLFAPAVPLQLSTNPMDWSSFNYVELTGYTPSSRSFPQGTEYTLDISSFKFKTMIWLTMPNKVSRAKLIQEIVTNLKTPGLDDMQIPDLGQWDYICDAYTPGNHQIKLSQTSSNTYNLTLLTRFGLNNVNGVPLSLAKLIDYYSVDYNSVSVSLLGTLEDTSPIIAEITNIISGTCTCTLNSLPPTTISAIDYLIDDSMSIYDIISTTQTDLTFVNNGTPFMVNGVLLFDNNTVLSYTKVSDTFTVSTIPDQSSAFINSKSGVYKYNKDTLWTASIKEIYDVGYWRLNFL